MVLGSAPKVLGDSGSVVYTFGSHLSTNESKYALYYSVPPVIQTGVKTNITFFIYLTELSGWKISSERQILQMIINTPTKTIATQKIENEAFIYQGARWGPFNMTVELNDSQVGLSPGQATNATVYANLVVYERYDDPTFPFLVDDGATLKLTDFKLAAAGASGSSGLPETRMLYSFAVGATVVVALTGIALVSRKKGRQGAKGKDSTSRVWPKHPIGETEG